MPSRFEAAEATIDDVHRAYSEGGLSCVELVEAYLERIECYDAAGPRINSIITINNTVLHAAKELDAARRRNGSVGGLHGIPVIVKDQVDAVGMPTTLGSTLFRDYFPDQNAGVVTRLLEAGALILAKATLGELAGGDTHGSLFGSTRNPYCLERTAGGSSGGSAASIAANFGMVAVGQESFASISRPSAWNSLVGMRPTLGLVSRSGA